MVSLSAMIINILIDVLITVGFYSIWAKLLGFIQISKKPYTEGKKKLSDATKRRPKAVKWAKLVFVNIVNK